MKPAPFSYFSPSSLPEAVQLMAWYGPDAKVIAGGQSLIPLMNLRLTRPDVLVDVSRIAGLGDVAVTPSGVTIGAAVTQAELLMSVAGGVHPLLEEAIDFVAHPQVRNRGTVGGSVAHADATAELPVLLVLLDGWVRTASPRGGRTIAADALFVTHLTTSLEPDEIVTQVHFPAVDNGAGAAFFEHSRRHGDFAFAGAGVVVQEQAGKCLELRIALLGAADRPIRLGAAERALAGRQLDRAAVLTAVREACLPLDPGGDVHVSCAYRKRLLEVLAIRAIGTARERAAGGIA